MLATAGVCDCPDLVSCALAAVAASAKTNEMTDGQGRALSAHRSKAYEGYAKRTEKRALAATRKRHAHKVASIALAEEKDRDIDAA